MHSELQGGELAFKPRSGVSVREMCALELALLLCNDGWVCEVRGPRGGEKKPSLKPYVHSKGEKKVYYIRHNARTLHLPYLEVLCFGKD